MADGGQYVSHLITVRELTEKVSAAPASETIEQAQQLPSWLSEFFPYAPYVLSFALFVGVFGVMIMHRVKSFKNIALALLLALFAAGTPAILSYAQLGGGQVTHAGPREQPTDVTVQKISETEAQVNWQTQRTTLGLVRYSEAPFTGVGARMVFGNDQEEVSSHVAKLTALERGQTYELEILSGDTWYDNSGSPIRFVFE